MMTNELSMSNINEISRTDNVEIVVGLESNFDLTIN